MTSYLSRDALLGAQDIEEREVTVPEWGGKVRIRSLTLEQAQRVREAGRNGSGSLDEIAATLAALIEGLAEPRLDPGDIALLRQKHAGAIARLGQLVMQMSGLTQLAVSLEEAKKV